MINITNYFNARDIHVRSNRLAGFSFALAGIVTIALGFVISAHSHLPAHINAWSSFDRWSAGTQAQVILGGVLLVLGIVLMTHKQTKRTVSSSIGYGSMWYAYNIEPMKGGVNSTNEKKTEFTPEGFNEELSISYPCKNPLLKEALTEFLSQITQMVTFESTTQSWIQTPQEDFERVNPSQFERPKKVDIFTDGITIYFERKIRSQNVTLFVSEKQIGLLSINYTGKQEFVLIEAPGFTKNSAAQGSYPDYLNSTCWTSMTNGCLSIITKVLIDPS